MLRLPDIAVGATIAALIAGLVSLLGLIISKEQKTSEFRQAWIDSLRAETSAFISHTNAFYGVLNPKSHVGSPREMWKISYEDLIGINVASTSIRLRLNVKERSSLVVLNTIEEIEDMINLEKIPDFKTLNQIQKRLIKEVNVLLKSEWVRVKDGEAVFQYAKYLAFAIVVVALCLGIAVAAQRIAVIHA